MQKKQLKPTEVKVQPCSQETEKQGVRGSNNGDILSLGKINQYRGQTQYASLRNPGGSKK